jgi:hypothetical protein
MYFYKLHLPKQKFTSPEKNTGIPFNAISVLKSLLGKSMPLSLQELFHELA